MSLSAKREPEQLITQNLDIWTAAIKNKATTGRGSNKKQELYGVKKLRELILELAVRGLLVPQDPNDEPASVLLEKIAAKKERLVKEGRIKKPKKLPEIEDEEASDDLPQGWAFCRFGEVLDFSGGSQPPKSNFSDEMKEGYVQLIQIRDLGPNPQPVYVPKESVSKFCTSADVMVGRYGASVGKVFWGKNGAYNVALIKLHNDLEVYTKEFLYLLMRSPLGQSFFLGISRSAQAGFSKNDIENCPIPVLGKTEQHRIVAKVYELMALCDQLEQQTESSLNAHQTLVETLLKALLDAAQSRDDGSAFEQTWQRIADNFDVLFTTEHSIDQLKQTILQLAVMGKLVPQDPNDEPAGVLLEKIAAEKERLVKEGKIKKQKKLPPISEEEKPFELPEGWEWCKFGLLAEFINGDRGKSYPNKSEYVDSGVPWINTGHIEPNGTLTKSDMNFITQEKFDSLRSGKIQKGDLVYCLRGATFGKTAFVEPYSGGAIASSLMIIRPFIGTLGPFFYRYLVSSFGRSQIFRFDNGSAQPNLSANSVMLYAFPCPPLNEQYRIVDKLAELFSFCDSLKAGIRESQTTQLHLADAMAEEALG